MNLLAFLVGIALPVILGWISLLLLERTNPVLGKTERWFFSMILGPTLFALIVFLPHVLGMTALTLSGFLIPSVIVSVILIITAIVTQSFSKRNIVPDFAPSIPLPQWMKVGILLLTIWTAIKILAGSYDLVSVPTYWDDSFNNWNMRGKMFYLSEKLVLEIPVGNGIVQSATGVSSYPVTVPLLKTWLSVLRGSWEEPLVNSLHLIWFIGLLGSFYFGLRRRLSPMLSLFGVYLLVSLPLLLIQATNPYADVFMAAHVLLPIICLFAVAETQDQEKMTTWVKLFGFSLGLMIFTKNEASVLYAPIMTILFVWILLTKKKSSMLSAEQVRKTFALFALLAILFAAPWLLFKWMHGLTFGNAKSVSGLTLSLNTKVIQAIWYHLSREPNWLLLPLLTPLVILLSGKSAFKLPEGVLTVFLLVTVAAQFLIFTLVSSLATEAIMQTGLSRGLLHVMPIAVMVVMVLGERLVSHTGNPAP